MCRQPDTFLRPVLLFSLLQQNRGLGTAIKMDPVTVIGITSSSVTLLQLLGGGVLKVKSMIQDIRKVDETTQLLATELDAFQSSLGVLEQELGRSSNDPALLEFWNPVKLDGLLVNAAKTFSRLQEIYGEISRQRSGLRKVREYLRTAQRSQEVEHLKSRISTYTTALNIPAVLFAIQGIKTSPSAFDGSANQEAVIRRINRLERRLENLPLDIQHDISNDLTNLENSIHTVASEGQDLRGETIPSLQANLEAVTASLGELLGNRISRLEDNITSISHGLRSLVISQEEQAITTEISIQQLVSRDSQELVEIANGLVSRASTITGSVRTISEVSTQSTVRIENSVREGALLSTAPSVVDPRTIRLQSADIDMSSFSVIGVPISSSKKESINSWMDDPDLGLGGVPAESELIFTPPPSTIGERQEDDIDMEIARRRWNLAQSLIVQGNTESAIPHLQRVLLDVEGHRIASTQWNRTDIEFLLAKSMMETSQPSEANRLFKAVYESSLANPLKRASAAHFLASLMSQHDRDESFAEAKSICLFSIRTRMKNLGPDDPASHSSISLMRDICRMEGDPDEALWNSMLPQKFQLSTIHTSAQTVSTFPAKMEDVRLMSNGNIIAYSFDGTRTIVRLINDKSFKLIREVSLSDHVASVTLAPDNNLRILVTGPLNKVINGVSFMHYRWFEAYEDRIKSSPIQPSLIPVLGKPKNRVKLAQDGSRIFWCHPGGCGYTDWKTWTHGMVSGLSEFPVNANFTVSSDGKYLASYKEDTIYVWDIVSKRLVKTVILGSEIKIATFSETPSMLIVYCGSGSLWTLDMISGKGETIPGNFGGIDLVITSQNHEFLACAKKKFVELRRFPSGYLISTLGVSKDHITAMTFAHDDKAIWIGYEDGALCRWTLPMQPK